MMALLFVLQVSGQKPVPNRDPADTTLLDYDEIFTELDALLNEVSRPRSFVLANVNVGNAYLRYLRRPTEGSVTENQLQVSPALSYFHKSGLGISAQADVVHDDEKLNPYQFALTGSYDHLKNRSFLTGISLTHYFQKKDLPFYTSPLHNDAFLYFTYRKHKLIPSVNFRYGWGSQESVTVQKEKLRNLRITRTITTVNRVADFTMAASVRYPITWSSVLSGNDYVRLTPQLSFVSGTQQFGFNQVSNIATGKNNAGKNTTFSTESLVLNDDMKFQPLALTAFLKTEYARGKFFIQPQVACDYYFPASTDNLSFTFQVNTGVSF